ncbi:DUF928 domain-containing protein [Phormidium sp. CCY1219]|uniref:DUF928 domain-containing protein n=1 Tax=Phormidium sp. CCY1219 TaxID=2886104 RepID=UPI002D1EAE4E|nr:DUF928 domain-containing protein [Phormidium sp. CCY1219]MEB3826137.1 DUF928 domain-containing protein [Phormidium sp. CCY1219]
MNRKTYYTSLMSAGLALCLGLFAPGANSAKAVDFVPPDNVGAPRGRVGGGTRGSAFDQVVEPGAPGRRIGGGSRGCSIGGGQPSDRLLTALIPESMVGLTVEEYPTFFWYLPPTDATAVEFVLMDEKGETVIYETTFRTKGEPGIVSLSLPENASLPPLDLDKNYQWYFSMICNPEDRAADIFVRGWIRRVEPTIALRQELQEATSQLERAQVYAQNGIWQDTLASLATSLRDNPRNRLVKDEWEQLMRDQGLTTIADAPLVQEITLESSNMEEPTEELNP